MSSSKTGLPIALPDFFRRASLSFLMRFGGLFFQFVGSILIARMLGAQEYGAFTYAATWAVFVGTFLPLGLGELSIRELPTYLTQKKFANINGYFVTALSTIIITGSVAGILLAVLEKTEVLVLFPGWQLVTIYALVHAFVLLVSNGLNGFQRILTSQLLETVFRQGLYLFLIGIILALGYSLTPTGVFQLSLLSALPALAIMVVVLAKMRRRNGIGRAKYEFELGTWFTGAIPLLMTTVASRLQLDLDVLMVGSILGNFDVGIYRAAARGAILVTIANMVAIQLVGPMLSRALAAGNKPEAQRLLSQAAIVSFLTGMPIILVLGFGSSLYLGLFGAEFLGAATSLKFLLIGQATIVLAGPDAILLIMLRKEKLVLAVTTLGLATNFGMNLALITPYGIKGAAIASLVSMAITRLVMVTFILRTTGFDPTLVTPIKKFFRKFHN